MTPVGEAEKKIAIISGRGSLPNEIALSLRERGSEPYLVGIKGEHDDWLVDFDHDILHWGQFGKLFKRLKEQKVTHILFAGGVTRPKIEISKMDFGSIKTLPQILAFMVGGDNLLLTGVVRVFEKQGVKVVGAHDVLPRLLSEAGAIVGRKPSGKAKKNLHKAFEACKVLGQLDIGQAAIAVGGRVVAVEGIEGTDDMLCRAADLRAKGRLWEDGRHGVLVKTMKPGQDMRVDLPAIGLNTVENAAKAGLAGIAIEAGKSIILQRDATLARARELDLFVFGQKETSQ